MRYLFLILCALLLSCGGGSFAPAAGGGTGYFQIIVREDLGGTIWPADNVRVQLWRGADLMYEKMTDAIYGKAVFGEIAASKYLVIIDSDRNGYPVEFNIEIQAGKRHFWTHTVDRSRV